MSEKRIIDPNKGYRIHFNVLGHSEVLPTFEQAHAGTLMALSKWYPNDPDLVEREARKVTSLQDLVTLMQTGDHTRLRDAKVIYGSNQPMSMNQFFIHGEKRLSDLYNRVGKIKGGDPVHCAFLFVASEQKTIGVRQYNLDKQGKKIGSYFNVSIKGQQIQVDGTNIDFELSFDYMKPGHLLEFTIPKGQTILVTGMARRSSASASHEIVQVHVDHEGAALWLKPEELTTPPPVREPVQVAEMPGFFPSRFD